MTETDPSQRLSESHACNQLGVLYNKMGQFPVAVRYFERHYKLAVDITKDEPRESDIPRTPSLLKSEELEKPNVDVAAVQLGISRGNAQMAKFFEHVVESRKLGGLLQWKARRTFDQPQNRYRLASDNI